MRGVREYDGYTSACANWHIWYRCQIQDRYIIIYVTKNTHITTYLGVPTFQTQTNNFKDTNVAIKEISKGIAYAHNIHTHSCTYIQHYKQIGKYMQSQTGIQQPAHSLNLLNSFTTHSHSFMDLHSHLFTRIHAHSRTFTCIHAHSRTFTCIHAHSVHSRAFTCIHTLTHAHNKSYYCMFSLISTTFLHSSIKSRCHSKQI